MVAAPYFQTGDGGHGGLPPALGNPVPAAAIADWPQPRSVLEAAPAVLAGGVGSGAVSTATPSVSAAEKLIESKHREYSRQATLYQRLYYTTRLCAALSAVLLPFVITTKPTTAMVLSLIVAVCTAVDVAFNPKDMLATYSNATDLLVIAELKKRGDYESHEQQLRIVLQAEAAKLRRVKDLGEMLRQLEAERPPTR